MANINRKGLPREVYIASVDLMGIWPVDTIEKRVKDMLGRMESIYPLEPDIICLPETFNTSWVREVAKMKLEDYAEDENSQGPVTKVIAEQAKKHNCYVVCPLITKNEGKYYNSAILLDRRGKTVDVYHKVHPVSTEILPGDYYKGGGITPGALEPPVFKTDFGTIGIQICYDADWWFDSWLNLKKAGAEIVFFPSQAPFENVLRYHAWISQYYVVSSTGEGARIIDITGDEIAVSGEFERWICATINLEKVLIHIWPYVQKFDSIRKKYGRRVSIKIYHPENWAVIESLDPEVKVNELLKEYEIPTYDGHLRYNEKIQNKSRP